ncbi:MAG TPA: cation:dicarboxylase symporter family transporter [Gemmatimonadota bacterium]|nr:cation:dicarboxylase symporter family transporter [Gemmatimonadota bacterium]
MNLSLERFSFGRSLTIATLAALAAGVIAGTLTPAGDQGAVGDLSALIQALGALWVRCLRMIILPLVVSLLVVAILGSRERVGVARMGGAAVGIYVAVYVSLAVLSLILFPPLIRASGVARGAMASLPVAASDLPVVGPSGDVGLADQLLEVFPTNPFAAAAEGNLLQVVVFTIVFALAAGRLAAEKRDALVAFFTPVAEAMLVVISWLLRVSPVAVFALAFTASREIGLDAAQALITFAIITSVVMVTAIIGLTLAAGIFGRVGTAHFIRAAWPGQLVALTTRSSLASVPALVEEAKSRLKLSDRVIGFGIPFAASTFKPNRLVSSPGKLLFLSWVYNIPIEPLGYAIFVGYVMLLAATTVGIPNQHARHVTLPAYLALGIPAEGVVLIASVDLIWDFTATALNATGYLAATTLLPRETTGSAVPEPIPEPVVS